VTMVLFAMESGSKREMIYHAAILHINSGEWIRVGKEFKSLSEATDYVEFNYREYDYRIILVM
jgi:hypothetical protein